MKKRILPAFALMFLGYFSANAQVGIGTFEPHKSAELDISSTKKGLLIPRIALTSTTVSAPISGTPAESLYIYNTAVVGDVTKGFYYWGNSKWNKVLSLDDVAKLQTLTAISLNSDGHNLNYSDEKGITTTIDLAEVVTNFETVTSLAYNSTGNTLAYTDENNTNHLIDIDALVKKNESITTFGLNADGKTLDYKSEGGITTQIDLSTVINNLEKVTKLTYDATANTLTYNDEDGAVNLIDIDILVKANETVTSLLDNADGTFTYNDEKGNQSTYNVNGEIQKRAWSLNGNTGTDQTTDFLGTTDAKPLIIKTNNTTRITVQSEGNVGVNVPEPTSSYAVAGSESHSIKTINANYTATDKDHTLVSKSSTAITLTLPNPSSCVGRIYYLVNNGTQDLTLTPAIEMASGITTTTLGTGSGINGSVVYGNRIKVQSDGDSYIVIQ